MDVIYILYYMCWQDGAGNKSYRPRGLTVVSTVIILLFLYNNCTHFCVHSYFVCTLLWLQLFCVRTFVCTVILCAHFCVYGYFVCALLNFIYIFI